MHTLIFAYVIFIFAHVVLFSLQEEDDESFETELDEEEFEVRTFSSATPTITNSFHAEEDGSCRKNRYRALGGESALLKSFTECGMLWCPCLVAQSAIKMGPVWKTYVVEMVIVAGMAVYLLNYFIGRAKNSSMAYSWYGMIGATEYRWSLA